MFEGFSQCSEPYHLPFDLVLSNLLSHLSHVRFLALGNEKGCVLGGITDME